MRRWWRGLLARALRRTLWLALGAEATHLLCTLRLSAAPVLLALALAAAAAARSARELRRPPPRLPAERAELAEWLSKLAALGGSRLTAVRVVETAAADWRPPSAPLAAGEIWLPAGVLGDETWRLLARAAPQVAAAAGPPEGRGGLLASGAAVGLLQALPSAAAALAGFVLLAAVVAWRRAVGEEERARGIDRAGTALLAAMRQNYPAAFAELAARQGLKGV
jgi:hypothetical protein